MRTLLRKQLSELGIHDIIDAKNGFEALRKYEEEKPDLIILDITMPEMSGLEVLRKIKDKNPNSIVVMCSAMGQQSIIIEAIRLGAFDFITKPYDKSRLIDVLRRVNNEIINKNDAYASFLF